MHGAGEINWEERLKIPGQGQGQLQEQDWRFDGKHHIFSYTLLNYVVSDLCRLKQSDRNINDPKQLSTEERQYLRDSIMSIVPLGRRYYDIPGEEGIPLFRYMAEHVAFFKKKAYTDSVYQKIVSKLGLDGNVHLKYLFDAFCKMFCTSYFLYCDLLLCTNVDTTSSFFKMVLMRIYNYPDSLFVDDVFRDIFWGLENKFLSKSRDRVDKNDVDGILNALKYKSVWETYSGIITRKTERLSTTIQGFDNFELDENQCAGLLGAIDGAIDDSIQSTLQKEEQEVSYNKEKIIISGAGLGLVAVGVGSGVLRFKNSKENKSPRKYVLPATFCLAGLAALGYAVKIVS